MKLNSFIKFVLQTILFFCGIPVLITLLLFVISIIKYGYFLGFRNLLLLDDVGLSLILYQSFLSPLLIVLFKKIKWIYIEFWSVFYLTWPILYFINGSLHFYPGNDLEPMNFLFINFTSIIIYYELFHKSYSLRKLLKINEKFSLKKLFKL